MKKQIQVIFSLLLTAALFSGVFPCSAAGTSVSAGSVQPVLGEPFTVSITVNADAPMYAVDFTVTYPSTLLRFDSGDSAVGGDGRVRVISTVSGASKGTYTLTFTPIMAGSAKIDITGVYYVGTGDGEISLSGTSVTTNILGEPVIVENDINGDGKMDVTDLVWLKKIISGGQLNFDFYTADINGDKALNAIDINLLRRALLGI